MNEINFIDLIGTINSDCTKTIEDYRNGKVGFLNDLTNANDFKKLCMYIGYGEKPYCFNHLYWRDHTGTCYEPFTVERFIDRHFILASQLLKNYENKINNDKTVDKEMKEKIYTTWKPEFGEKVFVQSYRDAWFERYYICEAHNLKNNSEHIHVTCNVPLDGICTDGKTRIEYWKSVKPYTVEYTRTEIAEKLGLEVDQLIIKD